MLSFHPVTAVCAIKSQPCVYAKDSLASEWSLNDKVYGHWHVHWLHAAGFIIKASTHNAVRLMD
jgi:hypothetical protein